MATETQSKQDPIGIRLDGRVALVTGGNRGIGAAICRSMASQGAEIAAGYSSNKERAEQFLEELKGEGANVTIVACSIRQSRSKPYEDGRAPLSGCHKRVLMGCPAPTTCDRHLGKRRGRDFDRLYR